MTRRPAVLIDPALRYDGSIPRSERLGAVESHILDLEKAAIMYRGIGMIASAVKYEKKARKLRRGLK